jgi:hexosaminidase
MLMVVAGRKWIAIAAIAAILVSGVAAAGEGVPGAGVVPMPAHIESRSGAFAIRAGIRILIPRDPRAARVARYFADLLQQTHGIKLETEESGTAKLPHAIVFQLDRPPAVFSKAPSSPEGYTVDISSDRIKLSANDPRGLLYAAVTLWQLCASNRTPGDAWAHARLRAALPVP